jgi:hypothetical protein
MAVAITAEDIKGAIGVGFASAADRAWADLCAAATNAYVNDLPIAGLAEKTAMAQLGATMLATDCYNRRPGGQIAPDFQTAESLVVSSPNGALWPVISRLLEIGANEPLWAA